MKETGYDMKQYIGIIRDHSASMYSLKKAAAKDYNETIAAVKDGARESDIDTIVSVVECGSKRSSYASIEKVVVNSSVSKLVPIEASKYSTNGVSTPLFDSVGVLVDMMRSVPDYDDPEVSFLVMVTTDGEENSSSGHWKQNIGAEIRALQATDRWTFVFRVPRNGGRVLTRAGVHEGNILEWDQNSKGFEVAEKVTVSAIGQFYGMRKSGARSTTSFYTNMSNVSAKLVDTTLEDITDEVSFHKVVQDRIEIRTFYEELKGTYQLGSAFYQLTKREKVQHHKVLAIRNRGTGKVYSGTSAKDLLGLPVHGDFTVIPDNHGEFDIFVMSTSVNRKLVIGTEMMIWKKVRVM